MYSVRKVTDNLYWVGVNDHRTQLFENIHPIPKGVSYNSYLLLDKETVLFDAVDWSACRQLFENLDYLLQGRDLDWLVINHMEPDHAASMETILSRWPNVKIVSTQKGFMLMRQFGFAPDNYECHIVAEGDTRCFGEHTVKFLMAPMVHWPECMVSYDMTNGVLFSGDAFGTFNALDGKLFADELNFDRDWLDEARRYLVNIVGKYGAHIQQLLKKILPVKDELRFICPLHGPVWRKDFDYIIEKYDKWSRHEPEVKGVLIAYASMYGNTESAAQALAGRLCDKGVTDVSLYDVSNTHVSYLMAEAWKYSHIVLASPTYNLNIYPVMHNFLSDMKVLNLQKRTVAIVENGSWACKSGDLMQKFITEELRNMTVLNERLTIASSMGEDKASELEILADAIAQSVKNA